MLDRFVNRPNRVPELQRHYQLNNKVPIYLRGGARDKVLVYGVYSLLAFGVTMVAYDYTRMVRGAK